MALKLIKHKIFHGKLLLFGEHIVNKGATGLAMPLEQFDGVFREGNTRALDVKESNHQLELLANFLVYNTDLCHYYDTNRLLEDIEQGLYFDSNIPKGYGLGSSAALVAAVYDRYYLFKRKDADINEVRNHLAQLESYYHGKSSGIDAIVSYTNKAVIVEDGTVSKSFVLPAPKSGAYNLFLINTHQERKTAPFVNLFLEKCKNKKFFQQLNTSLIPANNEAIDAFLNSKHAEFWKAAKIISQVQLDMLPEFIPERFLEIWKHGLLNDQFCLKICGAGGGGFIIGFARADANLHLLIGGCDYMELMEF